MIDIRDRLHNGFSAAHAISSTCALLTQLDAMTPDAAIGIAGLGARGAGHLVMALDLLEVTIEDLAS